MAERVRVKIIKAGYIPGVGIGPYRTPITIPKAQYELLKNLGYNIILIEDAPKTPPANLPPIKLEKVEETATKEVKEEKEVIEETATVEPEVEEVIEEEVVTEAELLSEEEEVVTEEVMVNDKDFSAEAYYTEDFLVSKAVCKKILDNRKIQYDSNASATKLRSLVMSSNPEVEIEE